MMRASLFRRAPLLLPLLLALALLLGPLAPLAPAPVSADHPTLTVADLGVEFRETAQAPVSPSHDEVTIWSATLTVQDVPGQANWGCHINDSNVAQRCNNSAVLTEDEFSAYGVSYGVQILNRVQLVGGPAFQLRLNKAIPDALKAHGKLYVDDMPLALSAATRQSSDSNGLARWWNPGFTWAVDDTVELRLTRPQFAGDLDPTFGIGGKVTTPFNTKASEIHAVAEQDDGKIVAVGWVQNANKDFALARYNPDGSLDTTFGTGGRVTTAIGTADDEARAVAIQSDGKIVVAGYAYVSGGRDFAAARYNTDGSLDTGFGTIDGVNRTGKLTTNFGANDGAWAVAIQSDGKIVLAGEAGYSFGVARYHPAGDPDEDTSTPAYTGFATDGKQTTDFTANVFDGARAVAIQSDGKIVLAGFATNNNGTTSVTTDDHKDFALARYTTTGALDTGFDTDGKLTTAISSTSNDEIAGMALQSDGKIVAAGPAHVGTYHEVALARYTTAGVLDTTFASNGSVVTQSIGSTTDQAHAVALQSDGKIVVAGYSFDSSTGNDFMVARYTSAGALDTAFNTTGSVTTPIGGGDDTARAVAIADDGSIIAAGYSNTGSVEEFTLASYTAAGALNGRFGIGGVVTTGFGGGTSSGQAAAVQSDGKIVVAGLLPHRRMLPKL